MNMSESNVAQQPEKRYSLEPAGYLLGRFGLLAALAGLLLAA